AGSRWAGRRRRGPRARPGGEDLDGTSPRGPAARPREHRPDPTAPARWLARGASAPRAPRAARRIRDGADDGDGSAPDLDAGPEGPGLQRRGVVPRDREPPAALADPRQGRGAVPRAPRTGPGLRRRFSAQRL